MSGWTRVQTVANGRNDGGSTLTATIAPTAVGNLLVAFASGGGSVSFSDGSLQTWTLGTEESNVPFSGKHYRFGWVLSTLSGVTTVTYTAGTVARWLQVMEYQPPQTKPALVAGSETNKIGTGVTSIGGALNGSVPSGSLVLIGAVEDSEGGTTFSVGSGINSLVGFGNDTNGSASFCVGENLNCAASPTANLTISPSNELGSLAYAFITQAPANSSNFFLGSLEANGG